MGRRENIKKRAFIAWNYMLAHLPRTNFGGLRALGASALSSALFMAGCALIAYALLFAPSAWAAEDTAASNEENTVNARQTADNSFLYDTSINDLTNADTSYQGDTVQIVGEVVGDSIRSEEDPGKFWITLEAIEEEYESSISVLVAEDTLGLIDTYGAYNRVGTALQVRGTFYLACPSHEGIMDIHAENVTLISRGTTTEDVFDLNKFIPGFVLVGIGLVLMLVYYYLRERER